MLEQVNEIIKEYEEIRSQLVDGKIHQNPSLLRKLSKRESELSQFYDKCIEYKKNFLAIENNQSLLQDEQDSDMQQLYQETIKEQEELLLKQEDELISLIQEADSDDKRNAIVEIRSGTGGDEAAIFAGDLVRMYFRYAEKQNWKIEVMNSNHSSTGGVKELIFMVIADKNSNYQPYGRLKYESGVHRVQRVPSTESSGRLHTSAASVVVIPEVDDIEVDIKDDDIKIDTYRSSGPGGQSVNTTDSAIRITHLPTDITVTCQDEKSQLKNKNKALSILKSKLYELEKEKQNEKITETRQSSIKTGDRSAKIRTYNFPQNRITDHRIKKNWYNLSAVLDGDLDEIIESTYTEISKLNS
jgi:peptide chain release factor 1